MDVCTRKFYEDQERVNYEAARALHLLSEASAELRAKVAETSVYPFVLLISTKFHALQLEGLKTLSFLSKSGALAAFAALSQEFVQWPYRGACVPCVSSIAT